MSDKVIHLSDGAYASVTKHGNVCITADHHNPYLATNTVYLEKDAAIALIKFLKEELKL